VAGGSLAQLTMSALLGEYYETLAKHSGVFTVIGEDGNRFSAQWEWLPSFPNKRSLGITGWARIGGKGGQRLHICAQSPCGAKWPATTYGCTPAPTHGQLAPLGAGAVGSAETAAGTPAAPPANAQPATVAPLPAAEAFPTPVSEILCTAAGTKSAVAEGSAVPVMPLAPPRSPTESAPPTPKPNSSPCAIPAVAEGSASSPSLGPAVVSAGSEVAPPPSPRRSAPRPSELVLPPRRGALSKGDFAPPCSPLPPLPPPPDQLVANAAPKLKRCLSGNANPRGDGMDVEEEPVIVGELLSPLLAEQIIRVSEEVIGQARAHVGVFAFLAFALCRRVRVFVWYGTCREDIVEKYAPWALEFISGEVVFEAIATKIDGDGRVHILQGHGNEMNHWVACVKTGVKDGVAEYVASKKATEALQHFYFAQGYIVILTVADGDCGFDVMCLMSGEPRRAAARNALRTELRNFVLKHAGNRALVACMFGTAEVSTHTGLLELATAGAALLGDVVHHGDGVVDAVHADHGDGVVGSRTFSDEELSAVKWKCHLHCASPEMIVNVLRGLPDWSIKQAVQDYNERERVPSKRKPKAKFILSKDCYLRDKDIACQQFLDRCRNTYGTDERNTMDHFKNGKVPYGWFHAYAKAHAPLARFCWGKSRVHSLADAYKRCFARYSRALKVYLQNKPAVAGCPDSDKEAEDDPDNYHARFKYLQSRQGAQYFDHRWGFIRDSKRRRQPGAGRQRSAAIIRELLMEWYSSIRHSVNCKIMCRFPKKVLLVKAQMLQEDYLVECLSRNVQPEPVDITGKWLNELLWEYRISDRVPNRKFKVPRWALSERLEIFWLTVAKLRKLVILQFGYDPDCRNIDQSPFHQNEAGSKACNSLALKGAPTVPLIENHAATRARWSLNSVTMSSKVRIKRRLPGFEIMFMAEGHVVEEHLEKYVFAKGLPFKVTVVTGPKGSYREEHILNFLEKHLERWGPGRRWEFIFLDAFTAGTTDNVQRCCWLRGYIEITHGGGASLVAQTNDTDHHLWVRKSFLEKQTALMIQKARASGGGLVDLTREENIDIMIEVMSEENLHLHAAQGYKYTGATNNLDGSEDSLICREANNFWDERGMRKKVDSAVAEVEAQFHAGKLPWNYQTVQSLIGKYPPHRCLDRVLPGQEDEATPDPDGVPWEVEEPSGPEPAAGDGCDDKCEGDPGDVLDFDPTDWVDPDYLSNTGAGDVQMVADASASSHHGHGGGDDTAAADGERHGDGGESLDAEQVSALHEHSSRVQALQEAKSILGSLGGALGAQLTSTVDQVMHHERKKFRRRIEGDAGVDKAMRASVEAEEAMAQRQRLEFRAIAEQRREAMKVEKQLKEAKARLAKTRKETRAAEEILQTRAAMKSFTPAMLGQGQKKGGGAQYQKARQEALDRVRSCARLAPEQQNDWKFFATTWDSRMAEAHGEAWGGLFAEILQNVQDELEGGNREAFSQLMHRESMRIMGEVETLRLPGGTL
jgi:hypothetical protein